MLINFPNQLTSEEEQLLKKIAKMKKKKKLFSEKKSANESHVDEHQPAVVPSAISNLKRSLSSTGKQLDAKEAAKKLVQSGIIKLETENKETGFKKSCSRNDSRQRGNLNIGNPDLMEQNKQVTYSSVTSPNSAISPPIMATSSAQNARFSYSSGDSQFSRTPSFNQRGNFRRNPSDNSGYQPRFQQKHQGVSLYIKANNVKEDLLRSLFNANVSQAKILSIDVKNNYAFVHVDTKESAEMAINELNGKTFQESVFSVSFARPRKPFNRGSNFPNQRSNFSNQDFSKSNETSTNSQKNYSSEGTESSNNDQRELVKYEDM
ncbi:negative elongation factor E-like [Brachionus plicatilis]|uniref:Negative elongation factor E n=1 Tax=Brachionus plicatilis TaxID=10195 RepID=A0A3M7QRC3_BRAPC|nr:negative elongation factor E-like [Brachionus plicatilis]